MTHRKTVRLWCTVCRAYVEYEGWVHGDRRDDPVHITPAEQREHRVTAHGATS